MGETGFLTIGGLFLTAILVAIVSQRLRLPYSVGLVAAGARDRVAVAAPGSTPPLSARADLSSSCCRRWCSRRRSRSRGRPLQARAAAAAGAGHGWAWRSRAAVVAGGNALVALGWSWIGAGLFGVLIAATDPVSVIAAFKQLARRAAAAPAGGGGEPAERRRRGGRVRGAGRAWRSGQQGDVELRRDRAGRWR